MKQLNRWCYAIIGIIVLLLAGLVYAWSVISKPIGAYFPSWTAAQLSMTFTLVMAFFCVGCLIAGLMTKKVKSKYFVIIAAILMLAGFFMASFANNLVVLYLGFGVLCGMGSGFAYNAVMSTMSAWFPDKQGLISGVLLMGFGLSSFLIGKVYAFVTPTDGGDTWRMTFRVLGILFFVVFMVCSFFFVRPGADFRPPTAGTKKATREPASEMLPGQMMKKPSFWFYYLWVILASGAGLSLVSQASGIAQQVGTTMSDGNIATVVGLISILNGIGRVFFGTLYDKKGHKLTMILDMILFVLAGLILIMALSTGQFTLIVVGFCVGGFAYGCVTPTNSALISDFYGRTNYPMNFSIINTNLIIASFASTIAGRLYDISGSYFSTIVMMIGFAVAGFVVIFGVKRPGNGGK